MHENGPSVPPLVLYEPSPDILLGIAVHRRDAGRFAIAGVING